MTGASRSSLSAGLLVYRVGAGQAIELFLVHPGGPFWAKKDEHAWSVPKGVVGPDEAARDAACREFREETGFEPPEGTYLDLGEVSQTRKRVHVWAVRGELDASAIRSNTTSIEWPPRSGRQIEIPEVDRAAWFSPAQARIRLHNGQVPLVDRLLRTVG